MPFAPFNDLFPDIGPAETRCITILEDGALPRGVYGFIEAFCNEEQCDCRRVFINVAAAKGSSLHDRGVLATISFGWEPESFYRRWASFPLSKDDLHELKGPALVRLARQSQYSPLLLKLFQRVAGDDDYVARIIRHYEMYRRVVDGQARRAFTVIRTEPKVGPNRPCPCGSGKKVKRCCATIA